MSSKVFSGILVSLLVISTLTLTIKIQLSGPVVKADNVLTFTQITICPDGSIIPSNQYTPIITDDKITYRLTNDIGHYEYKNDGIALSINRSNIVLDGAGHRIYDTIPGATWPGPAGIFLSNIVNVTIKDVFIDSFFTNLEAHNCSSINVISDTIRSAIEAEIFFDSCQDSSIIGNNITASLFGPEIGGDNDVVANNNVISLAPSTGPSYPSIHIGGLNCMVLNNTVVGNCIKVDASDSIVKLNKVTGADWGILMGGTNNSVIENTVTGGSRGFVINDGWNSFFIGNTVQDCTLIGMDLNYGGNETFYRNNIINNHIQAYLGLPNTCDSGYPSGGNYWSDYTDVDSFKGPNQNVPGSDGIWDHPYVINANNIDPYPLVNPWVPIESLVVRGMDNRIYYQVWNGTGWQGWNVLPGSTMDSPAAVVLGNQLHVVVRGSDGNSLWYGYLTNITDPGSFSGWTLLSGATSSAPTLTSNSTTMCLVVRGLDNRIYYRIYDTQAQAWQGWNVLPSGATCDRPAASMLGNNLHIVVRGMDGSSLWDTIVNYDGTVVRGWNLLSGATPSTPVPECSGADNLYLVVRGMDNAIYYRSYTGSADSWGDWNALPTGATNDGPGSTVMGNMLCTVVRGMDGSTLWCGNLDMGTGNFLGWTLLSGSTSSAPTLIS